MTWVENLARFLRVPGAAVKNWRRNPILENAEGGFWKMGPRLRTAPVSGFIQSPWQGAITDAARTHRLHWADWRQARGRLMDAVDERLRAGVAVVSHVATRTGAPIIALNIERELAARDIPVVTILLAPGELQSEFAKLGPVLMRPQHQPNYHLESRAWARAIKRGIHIAETAWHVSEDGFWKDTLRQLANRKIRHAICNTVLSGSAALRLKSAGVTSIGLVHELPHSIRIFGWTDAVADFIEGTAALIFPCEQVRAAFAEAFPITNKPSAIFPQGCAIDPGRIPPTIRESQRAALRAELGLSEVDVLVLACGTGDFRKGIDLFVQTARELTVSSETMRKIVLAWAGPFDWHFRPWADKDVVTLDLADRLIFLGPQSDMAPYYAAADIFFLPSREDPYPTVVLEAMANGLPVVGFAGSGGFVDQVSDDSGVAVPYADVGAATKVIRELAAKPDKRSRMGGIGRRKIEESGGYKAYARNLMTTLSTS